MDCGEIEDLLWNDGTRESERERERERSKNSL
jgi:hypothetical protein